MTTPQQDLDFVCVDYDGQPVYPPEVETIEIVKAENAQQSLLLRNITLALRLPGEKTISAEVIDLFNTMNGRITELESAPHHNGMMQLSQELASAKRRIAELESTINSLRESMAAIHNTIKANGAATSLSALLTASKRAYESCSGVNV